MFHGGRITQAINYIFAITEGFNCSLHIANGTLKNGCCEVNQFKIKKDAARKEIQPSW
ncbi:MAG: hypothetical protein ACI9JY_000152 [Saprospiraceae bacterium]|jgi:hypothetical protein